MTKQKIIQEIKNELSAYQLNIGEDTFQDCPIHKQISKDEVILIESIYSDKVCCTHYIHETAIDTLDLNFEQISKQNLQLILENVLEANEYLKNN